MADKPVEEELIYKSRIKVPYTWSVGKTNSRFLRELRDNKKIFGIKCGECSRVYIPPKKQCPHCFIQNEEWIELPGTGQLASYTIRRYESRAVPQNAPDIYGLIKLDGADNGIVHFLSEVEHDSLEIGMKVEAVFKDKREGHILDIEYFRPTG